MNNKNTRDRSKTTDVVKSKKEVQGKRGKEMEEPRNKQNNLSEVDGQLLLEVKKRHIAETIPKGNVIRESHSKAVHRGLTKEAEDFCSSIDVKHINKPIVASSDNVLGEVPWSCRGQSPGHTFRCKSISWRGVKKRLDIESQQRFARLSIPCAEQLFVVRNYSFSVGRVAAGKNDAEVAMKGEFAPPCRGGPDTHSFIGAS